MASKHGATTEGDVNPNKTTFIMLVLELVVQNVWRTDSTLFKLWWWRAKCWCYAFNSAETTDEDVSPETNLIYPIKNNGKCWKIEMKAHVTRLITLG